MQKNMLSNKDPLALYIHWPFCLSKCPYCDFNSHVQANVPHDQWEKAYLAQLHRYRSMFENQPLKSIFFGGGTPSLMPTSMVARILEEVEVLAGSLEGVEITLEANPTSVEASHFETLRAAGINRISLGIQSLRAEALRFLGREHNVEEAKAAIETAKAHFDRWSFDLIYGRPEQTLESWQEELEEALALGSSHLSLYMLTVEKGTPFYKQARDGLWTLPPEEESAKLFEWTRARMQAQGMPAYEVSNFARPGQESTHNLHYWRYRPYLGIGPGAHSRIVTADGQAEGWMMRHKPSDWLAAVENSGCAIQKRETISSDAQWEEAIMMGLRVGEGIRKETLTKPLSTRAIQQLCDEGLLIDDGTHIRLTEPGFAVLNQIIACMVT